MRDRKYRVYTEEFKLEALALLKRGEKSAPRIEQDLGITPGMLLKWKNRYQMVRIEGQKASLEPSDLEAAKREIRRLERQVEEIAEEREILKKVVSIFSRKSA